uniref:Reverse transcriptase domain-containing protein n=1 Tax=Esox lucius TaxID=8010 RepID=A0A3P8Z5K2_ESOLU
KKQFLFEKKAHGLRQGEPLSALLYVLYIEPLACAIRKNQEIRGLRLPGVDTLKNSLYADDMVLYLLDERSLRDSTKVTVDFSVASGSKINKNKTEIKFVGRWKWRTDRLCGLTVCRGPMVVLGVSFGNEMKDDLANWIVKIKAVNRRLGLWKVRRLSFSGKVLVLKADILPSLLHLAYVFPVPVGLRKMFTRAMFNFFWGGYEYVRRDWMYQTIGCIRLLKLVGEISLISL